MFSIGKVLGEWKFYILLVSVYMKKKFFFLRKFRDLYLEL